MAARSPSDEQPSAARTRRRSQPPAEADPASSQVDEAGEEQDIAADLNFREAQTALELSLAGLQSPELDVEEMAGLYRRASRYAERCEQLLQRVEQEVMQWDPTQPEDSPTPYQG